MRPIPMILVAVVAAAVAYGAAPELPYHSMALVVPAGDPAAGRAAFSALSCTTCHQVAGDPSLRAPASANPGPTLGKSPARSPDVLASAIVAPSHRVPEVLAAGLEGTLSPMADYTEVMTVRQLIDLVAYLQAPGEAASDRPSN